MERTLADLARCPAGRHPDKIAIQLADGSEALSYQALDRAGDGVAAALIAAGIGPGDRVALLARNGPRFVVAALAIARAGAVPVPLSIRAVGDDIAALLAACTARLVLTEAEFRPLLPGSQPYWCLDDGAFTALYLRDPVPLPGVDPADPGIIMFTSGTSGRAKGVTVSHHHYLHLFRQMARETDLTADDVLLLSLPLFHNGGFVSVLGPALLLGATVICQRGSFDADATLEQVAQHRVTAASWIPTMLVGLVDAADRRPDLADSLRKIFYGSMPISPELLARARTRLGADFYQIYGSTDCGLMAMLRPEHHDSHPGATGRLVADTVSQIVDSDGRMVPVGAIGEMVVDAATSGMIGYWGEPDRTNQVLRHGWLHTGDLVRRDPGGFITLIDRQDSMVISGGEKIYPAEVEIALADHPALADLAIIGIPDPLYGETICAIAVLRPSGTLTLEELRHHGEGRLARFKLPRRLMVVETLPRTATGKIARGEIRRWLAGRDVVGSNM